VCLHLAAVLRREIEAEQAREAACMTSDATSAATLAAVALQQRAAAADSIMHLLSQYKIVGGSELAAYLAHSEAVMVQCGLAKRPRVRKGASSSVSVSGSDCGSSFCSGKHSILFSVSSSTSLYDAKKVILLQFMRAATCDAWCHVHKVSLHATSLEVTVVLTLSLC
jgi:hypothetical protein